METSFPFTQPEIIDALRKLSTEGQTFWSAIPPEVFVDQPEKSWSPAQNVLHLIRAVKPVAKALNMPRWLLRLLFGKATAPSRHGGPLKQEYLEQLKTRGATGKYAPAPVKVETTAVDTQQKLVMSLTHATDSLAKVVEKWNEPDLDRLQLPHPLLGKLTVREMLLFTIFHIRHHMENVRVKLLKS